MYLYMINNHSTLRASQRFIADQIGVNEASLSRVLNGKRKMSKQMAKRLAEFTGRDFVDFFRMRKSILRKMLIKHAHARINKVKEEVGHVT